MGAAEGGRAPPARALAALMAWAAREGADVSRLRATGRELVAAGDEGDGGVPAGGAAAALPRSILLRGSGEGCDSSLVAAGLRRMAAAGAPEAVRVAAHLALCAAAVEAGTPCRWGAYVAALPHPPHVPLCWPRSTAVDVLREGTAAGARLAAMEVALAEAADKWLPLLDDDGEEQGSAKRARAVGSAREHAGEANAASEDAFAALAPLAASAAPHLRWALACVLSRAFSVPDAREGGNRELACVPVLDMLDHDGTAVVEYRLGAGGAFELVLPKGAAPGTLLKHNYETYGERRDNAQWLTNYGFRVEEGGRDAVRLALRAPGGAGGGAAAGALLRSVGRCADEAELVIDGKGGEVPRSALAAVAAVVSSELRYGMQARVLFPPSSSGEGGKERRLDEDEAEAVGARALVGALEHRAAAAEAGARAAAVAPDDVAFDPCREAARRTLEAQADAARAAATSLSGIGAAAANAATPAWCCLSLDIAAPEHAEDDADALLREALRASALLPAADAERGGGGPADGGEHHLPLGLPAACIKRVLASLAVLYLPADELREAGGEKLAAASRAYAIARAAEGEARGDAAAAFDSRAAGAAAEVTARADAAFEAEIAEAQAFAMRLEEAGWLSACCGHLAAVAQAEREALETMATEATAGAHTEGESSEMLLTKVRLADSLIEELMAMGECES